MNDNTTTPIVSVIGAGNVGAACAANIVAGGIASVRLFDIIEDVASAKAMDVNHASASNHSSCSVSACSSLHELSGSGVVVFCAGAPRRSGMTRKDLLEDNWDVLSMYCTWIMKYCPEAILLVVTNPVDVLATLARRRFGGLNVIGLGCSLDTVRFEYHLAEAAGVAVQTVHGLVVGSHDDNMLPLVRLAQIGYAPASDVLTDDQLNDVVDKTRRAGHVIVEKLHRGSWYAAAVIVADIVETILSDSQNTFCLNVPCDGELGFDGVCLSLPTMVGANGAGKPLPLPLNRLETEALRRSGRSIDEAANTAFSKSAGVLSGVVSLSGRG